MISPPARNFLNSSFVNVTSLRAIEGEPLLEISAGDAAARGIADGQRGAHLQRPRQHRLQGRRRRAGAAGRRQRPRRLVAKLAADGKNVNELTHQRLTDIGRAPSFYDCLVEVEAAAVAGRGVRRGARVVARHSAGSRRPCSLAGAAVCLTSGCGTVGYYARVGRPATSSCCRRARPVPRVARRPGDAARR